MTDKKAAEKKPAPKPEPKDDDEACPVCGLRRGGRCGHT